MGYKTMVIRFDDRINNFKALSLVSEADAEFQAWGASTYMTDKYTVTKVKDGYRITKRYNIEPICKWRAPNTCKVCAQDRCDE